MNVTYDDDGHCSNLKPQLNQNPKCHLHQHRLPIVQHLKIDCSDDELDDVADNLNTMPMVRLDKLNLMHAFVLYTS